MSMINEGGCKLVPIPSPDSLWKFWMWGRRYYRLEEDYTYISELTGESLSERKGWVTDGATAALDVRGNENYPPPWIPHDIMCEHGVWDNGDLITRDEAAEELEFLLKKTGHWLRAKPWKVMTYYLGCSRVKGQ